MNFFSFDMYRKTFTRMGGGTLSNEARLTAGALAGECVRIPALAHPSVVQSHSSLSTHASLRHVHLCTCAVRSRRTCLQTRDDDMCDAYNDKCQGARLVFAAADVLCHVQGPLPACAVSRWIFCAPGCSVLLRLMSGAIR